MQSNNHQIRGSWSMTPGDAIREFSVDSVGNAQGVKVADARIMLG